MAPRVKHSALLTKGGGEVTKSMKVHPRGEVTCQKLADPGRDLSVCASACALVMRHLRNPLFCDDDSVACMPIAMAPRDRSFDMTTAPIDVSLLSLT